MQGEFQKFVQDANIFINDVAEDLKVTPKIAHQAVKSVFYTVREFITPEESLHLISQLPLFLKAVYVDGWKLSHSSNYKNIQEKDDFLNEITLHYNRVAKADDATPVSSRLSFETIFDNLSKYLDDGELEHIRAQFPKSVKELIQV